MDQFSHELMKCLLKPKGLKVFPNGTEMGEPKLLHDNLYKRYSFQRRTAGIAGGSGLRAKGLRTLWVDEVSV